MRNRKLIPFKAKPKVAVVVDGETEFWYLQMIKRNESAITVDIKPEIPQKKKLAEQYDRVIELSKIYDKVIWIIDLDVVLAESAVARKAQNPFHQLLKFQNLLERQPNITLIINQPCLEYWLLLHFEFTAPHFTNCANAEKLLKKHLPDYEKSEKYYVKKDADIYLKLKDRLPAAIVNSKKFEAFDQESPNKGFTEMHNLFKELGLN